MKKKKRNGNLIYLFVYLDFCVITILVALFLRQTFFYFLLVGELLLPVISRQLAAKVFFSLTPELTFMPPVAQKNHNAYLRIRLKNPYPIPFPSASFMLTVSAAYYDGSKKEYHVLPLLAKSDNLLEYPVFLNKCGMYEARLSELEGTDFLHIFSFHREVDIISTIRVFPQGEPTEIMHETIYSEGFDEYEESTRKGNVSSNVTDIREYQPGDRLQKIHWKLSEKLDKLYVKENESTSTNEFFLLMELFQPALKDCNGDIASMQALDDTLEHAFSIALELLEAGEIFSFVVYSTTKEDFVSFVIRSREDLENAFTNIYYEPSYETEDLALTVYERAGMNKGTLIHVTHKGADDVSD